MDGESGRQGYLLHNSNTYRPLTLSEVSGSRALSITVSAIWSVMCIMGVYQSDEACCNLSSCHRGVNDSLHKQHSSNGRYVSAAQVKSYLEVLMFLLTGLGVIVNLPNSCHQ